MAKTEVKGNTATAAAAEPEMFNPVIPEGAKIPNFAEWSDEQVSFAPYWKPAVGKWFYGVLTDVDMRDPKFIRYQFQAMLDTPCQRGPGDETDDRHEKVMVPAGGLFSVSLYEGLKGVFQDYASVPFPVAVRVEAVRKDKTKEGQDFWMYKVQVDKPTKALLTEYRTKKLAALGEKKREARPALQG